MTPRELVLEAISHRRPTRLPTTLYLDATLKERLREQCGFSADNDFHNDTVRILWDVEHRNVDDRTFYDPFGVPWDRSDGAYFFRDPPLIDPDASQIPRIRLIPPTERARVEHLRARNPDRFVFYQFTMTFGERLWALRGMEQYLADLVEHPGFVHEALDVLLEMHMAALDEVLRWPIDGVTFGDDFGSQKGLMISPAAFREFFRPRLAKMYERVRRAGLVVGAHSCGDNTAIMRDYVEIGLQVFHPLQPECMDIRAIKREYGRDLSFRGGIGTQGAVVFGRPEDVRRLVLDSAEVLADGGGYLLEPCKPLPLETPVENAMVFIEAMESARDYRFG